MILFKPAQKRAGTQRIREAGLHIPAVQSLCILESGLFEQAGARHKGLFAKVASNLQRVLQIVEALYILNYCVVWHYTRLYSIQTIRVSTLIPMKSDGPGQIIGV
ncbi:Hypothetical_protein [Hexamita inflata]|uniref:Hypothetical_protein n=1 Tax=Hexamita inflata TaxID=28002 RepID=A0ABP1HQD2_9EUKA